MECLFLYNPNSGKGRVRRKIGYIVRKLRGRYDRVEVCETESAEDLTERVREGARRFDAIVFSGGDGTFNRVLQGAEGTEAQLGYLPSGTVNDVARSLGIPRSVKGALKVILRGNAEKLDCMRVGDRYAMYVAAAGAFTRATYTTKQSAKRTLGALAYALEALKNNMKLQVFPVHATADGQSVETHAVLVLVLNGRSVAGFPINRKGSMKDGVLEMVVIKQVQKPNAFRKLGALFSVASLFIFGCGIRKRDVLFLRGKEIGIETGENVVWDLDGEEGACGDARISVCPSRVKLFVPKKKKL